MAQGWPNVSTKVDFAGHTEKLRTILGTLCFLEMIFKQGLFIGQIRLFIDMFFGTNK